MNFSESLALKAVSLLLALILWITILGFKREEIKTNIKFEPLLPPGMVLVSKIPSHIQFTLSGPRVLLKDVQKKIPPIRPDLRLSRESAVNITISEDVIGELPNGIHVMGFYPPNVPIRLEEVVERYVPVKPTVNGSPAEGYEIALVVATPTKVAVSGPKSFVESLGSVGTEIVDVHDLKGTKEADVNVEVDTSQGFQLPRTSIVHVKVTTKKVHRGND
jgi:YbbR domain-containing protein